MSSVLPRLRPVMIVLLGIYLSVWPGSTLLVALDRVPAWGTWMGGALLILQGLLMNLWLVANHGRRGVLAACCIFVISWAVEYLGVTTGFPFGSYGYTNALLPKLGGVVPLAIPFAWLLVVPAAVGTAERLLGKNWSQRWYPLLKVVTAASLALLLDMTIEPVAVHINGYWVWLDGGTYYGVPVSNFVAWWATSVLIITCVLLLIRAPFIGTARTHGHSRAIPMLPHLPLILYLLNLLMFVLVNLAHSQLLAAAIGALLLSALAAYILSESRKQKVGDVRRYSGEQID